MYPFKEKIIGDIGYNDYPFPFEDGKNGKPRFMKTFEVLIETRTNEILDFFEAREECQQYIIENELRMYLTEESFYKADALTVRNYGIHLNRHNTFTFAKKEEIIDFLKPEKMKFDYIIQNPPYNRSLHLDFLEKGLDLLTPEKGRMVIIEPATWLINVRKNGNAKKYDAIKNRIEGYVESVKIENFNKDFNTNLFMPFAITTIDFSKTFDEIEFICCGEKKVVKSIYDCNLVGDYATVWSIIEKCQKFGDMMKAHITKENMGEGMFYSKFAELDALPLCQTESGRVGRSYENSDGMFQEHKFGKYCTKYSTVSYHYYRNGVSDTPFLSYGKDKKLTNKIADNIYGTRQELENWKHFIFNNKLPLFLNIVLTIDQNNNSKEFLPWLVDKQYTDDEINKLFSFTEEEITLIDRTIKKYERNSPWFKRYMCGPGSVNPDHEKEEKIINKFINNM